ELGVAQHLSERQAETPFSGPCAGGPLARRRKEDCEHMLCGIEVRNVRQVRDQVCSHRDRRRVNAAVWTRLAAQERGKSARTPDDRIAFCLGLAAELFLQVR